MLKGNEMNKTAQKALLQALTNLVSGEAINQDECGGCVYCGGSGKEGPYGYCDESYDCHQDDCEWVAGRKIVTAFGAGLLN